MFPLFFFYINKFGLKPFLDKGMIPLTENDTSVLSCPYVCPDATSKIGQVITYLRYRICVRVRVQCVDQEYSNYLYVMLTQIQGLIKFFVLSTSPGFDL